MPIARLQGYIVPLPPTPNFSSGFPQNSLQPNFLALGGAREALWKESVLPQNVTY